MLGGMSHPGQPPWFPHQTVDADPESAGLSRKERPGWALLFVAGGALLMLGSLVLPWVSIRVFEFSAGVPNFYRRHPGIFDVLNQSEEVRADHPDVSDPSVWGQVTFPWLLIALTVVAIVVAAVAAWGLRKKLLTTLGQIAGLVIVGLVALFVLGATMSLGTSSAEESGGGSGGGSGGSDTSSATTAPRAPSDEPAEESFSIETWPHLGGTVWFGGAFLLGVATMLGPRVTYLMPHGGQAWTPPGPPTPGTAPQGTTPQGTAPQGTAPQGWMPPTAQQPMGQAMMPTGPPIAVVRRTQVVALVLTLLGVLLGFAGYGFLSWSASGDSVTFSEIGDAARDIGFDDKPVIEAYFAWLGWVVLLLVVVTAALVGAGLKPVMNPVVVRPILAAAMIGSLLLHLWVLVDLGGNLDSLGPGVWAVTVGLALAALGTILPLRTTARMAVNHPRW